MSGRAQHELWGRPYLFLPRVPRLDTFFTLLPILQDIMVGDEAAALRRALEISYPLENGVVRKWDDMEHVWRYLFDEKMHINPREKKVLLTEAPLNPKANRKKMMEVMFEKYVVSPRTLAFVPCSTLVAAFHR